jgi:hypothetical protein
VTFRVWARPGQGSTPDSQIPTPNSQTPNSQTPNSPTLFHHGTTAFCTTIRFLSFFLSGIFILYAINDRFYPFDTRCLLYSIFVSLILRRLLRRYPAILRYQGDTNPPSYHHFPNNSPRVSTIFACCHILTFIIRLEGLDPISTSQWL